METSNPVEEVKDTLKDENWEVHSDEEEEVKAQKAPVEAKKQVITKDKHGEIIISKMDAYVEPTKTVKETRGDNRMANKYNFGDLSFDEDEDEEEEAEEETVEVPVETEQDKKKKKAKAVKKQPTEDLDDLLNQFGIETKTEPVVKLPPKEKKVKPVVDSTTATTEANEQGEDNANAATTSSEPKKKKKKTTTDKSKKTAQHVNELKREILERKEALKKKEKKKGI